MAAEILPITALKILAIRQYACKFLPCSHQNYARTSAHKKILNRPKTNPQIEKSHGRIEKRQYFLSTEINDFIDSQEWKGIAAIGMVKSKRIINNLESFETRYFITSLTDINRFAKAVRTHWSIENNLHWCLDMNFNEDKCRMRMDNSGENLAVIRHISLNLYKSFTSIKLSMKAKRFRCAFDDDFLSSVVLNKFF